MGRVNENLEDHFRIPFLIVAIFSPFCEKKKSQQNQQRIDQKNSDFNFFLNLNLKSIKKLARFLC